MSCSFISGAEIYKKMKNAIHEKKQVAKDYCYLTVSQVYEIDGTGSLDFGGKELTIAPKKKLCPEKKQPEDQYGWWNLKEGSYLLEFNEGINLEDNEVAIIQPRKELLSNGCFHPTVLIMPHEEVATIPLVVGSNGLNIKENARISMLRITRMSG